MKVVVDANIVFSGILQTNGKIADLLITSNGLIDFIAPDFLRSEIRKHHKKLVKVSRLSQDQILESESLVCRDIKFISEEQVQAANWQIAFELVKDVDEKDIPYVAFAQQFNRVLWSGDKKLMRGLKKKGFDNFITTDALYALREELRSQQAKKKR